MESSAKKFVVELVTGSELSPSVRSLLFRPAGGFEFAWRAGQYVELRGPELGPKSSQPYSIASAMGSARKTAFEIAVLRGPDTVPLHELAPGKRLGARGPLGSFTRRPATGTACVFIGTGTGLAPLRAMIQEELEAPSGPEIRLLFGCRCEEEILWERELYALGVRYPRFHFEPTLSQPHPGWPGRCGWVQEHLKELVLPAERPQVYVCGRAAMVSDCVRRLEHDVGLEQAAIFTEAI